MRPGLLLYCFLFIACGPPFAIDPPVPEAEPSTATASEPNAPFKIIVLDVGQGDAVLMIAPEGEAAIIDTGPEGRGNEALETVLAEQQPESIAAIFISHDHEDHRGGLEPLLEALGGAPPHIIDKQNAIVGETYRLGSVQLRLLAGNGRIGDAVLVEGEHRQEENNLSLALLVEYGAFRYFTSGDLPGGGGNPPYQTIDLETPLAALVGDIDILLVPHHGSNTSSNAFFLDQLQPEVAILSLGNGNDFFHPHPTVTARLKERGIRIVQTERGWLTEAEAAGIEIVDGHICIVTDGETYTVKPYALDQCDS